MKKRAEWVALAFFALASLFITFRVAAQQNAPELTLEQRAAFLDAKNRSLQIYIALQNIQKKYDQAMQNDPEYQKAFKEGQEVSQELQKLILEAQKGVDPKKWTLDINTLKYVPVKNEAPPQLPPAEKKP